MKRSMNKKLWVVMILAGILLFHFINNFIWFKKDNFVTTTDANWHVIEALKFHIAYNKILHSHESLLEKTVEVIQTFRYWPTTNWPPMVYFLSAIICPQKMHLFFLRMYVNFIFYIVLVLSAYFLGKKCFNRGAGLIAAFLISFYPAVFALSRQFGLDFPLLCSTAVCLCFLLYSENFSKRGYSLLFGLSLGLGTLVKLQIMFFLLAPLLYAIGGIFRAKNSEKLNGFSNFILSSAIAFGLFSLYWGNRVGIMAQSLLDHVFIYYPLYKAGTSLTSSASIPIFSLPNVVYYLEGLLAHVYLFPFILFLCAMAVLFISKNKWRFFYLCSFLIPYFMISFISVKSTRYALPLLIFMAVLSGWLIDSIRLKYIKILTLCVLVFYAMNLYFLNSWTLERYVLVPRSFLKLLGGDMNLSNAHPPNAFDYTEELKKAGIIPYIEQKVGEGQIIRVEYQGVNVEDPIASLFIYFQNAIANGKISIRVETSGFRDANFIVIREPDFFNKKDLFHGFRILARINGSVFLIKNIDSTMQ
jgi:Dolichyl-phosphate-mannose-protein mannosyltransferase